MDETDVKILKILQQNGRISMKDLGKLVALSPPAVTERVKKLEENNIITGYRATINYEKIGRPISVIINVDMNVDMHNKFKEFVLNNNYIVECHHVTGPYCMIVKASLNEMSELEKLIAKIQTFGNTETLLVLSSPLENKVVEPILKNFE